jgi:hypothetical protein
MMTAWKARQEAFSAVLGDRKNKEAAQLATQKDAEYRACLAAYQAVNG